MILSRGAPMTIFSTEFAVQNDIDRGKFAAQVIAWVKGMSSSTLFDSRTALSEFTDEASVEASTGERLTLKECLVDEGFIIGARHEMPDDDGRVWISEVTLKSKNSLSALRVKTQCTIDKGGARAQTPKKPYFIKLAIEDEWPVKDGSLHVRQVPVVLQDSDLELASDIVSGGSDNQLPVIYISKKEDERTILSEKEIRDLAFRLGGVAHVVVEPDRAFSKKLIAQGGARAPYGGSLAICVGGHGVVKRYFIGSLFPDSDSLVEAVCAFSLQYVTNRRSRIGADWQHIIEESSRILRRKLDEGTVEFEEWLKKFDEDDSEKDKRILSLQEQLDALQEEYLNSSKDESSLGIRQVLSALGAEIYKGEFIDRVRSVLVLIAHDDKIHPRTVEMCRRILQSTSWSDGAQRLQARLKAAGKDSSTADDRLSEILMGMGYKIRKSGGHPVCSPDDLFGLSAQTMSSSASDHRAGKNAAQRIIRDLGLDALQD